jgi:putative ABC transport system permease protein
MLFTFLKITWRRLWRNRLYTSLNVLGLSVGLAISFLIGLYIVDELQYNRNFSNQDRIYRSYAQTKDGHVWSSPAYAVGPYLKEAFPEVEASCRFFAFDDMLLSHDGKTYREDVFGMADDDVLEMFDIQLIEGKKEKVLEEPRAMILSKETAERYFGDESAIGEVFTVNSDTISVDFIVRAVMSNTPDNSMYPFNFLIPFTSSKLIGYKEMEGWDRYGPPTYVMLEEEVDISAFAAKTKNIIQENSPGSTNTVHFQPLSEVYLYDLEGNGGRIEYVWIFGIIALLLLLIGCINFMNLATAQSLQRAKEVGVRKTIGARRSDLIRQFFGESILLTVLSGLVALSMMQLLLPVFNELAGKTLSWHTFDAIHWFAFWAIIALTGILAGSYPAFLLSSFRPVAVLKGRYSQGRGQGKIRQSLVVVQFTLSIMLITGTLIAQQQMNYIQEKNMGFDREQVVYIDNIGDMMTKLDPFKARLEQSPHVISATAVSNLPTHIYSHGGTPNYPGKAADEQTNFLFSLVDSDYLETFNMEMAQGRFFSFEEPEDSMRAYVINEKAAAIMRMEEPVGSPLSYWGIDGQIIGVVKDFHTHGVIEPIKPVIMMLSREWINNIAIKLEAGDPKDGLADIEEAWTSVYPHIPFECQFLDEEFARQYEAENRTATLYNYLAYIAIFISCLGLFGLAAFTVERKGKEIGLRKVLGANLKNILQMLLWHFTRPILISMLIAAPLSWYIMTDWLEGFEFHISPQLWMIGLASGLALLIAWLTVGFQSFKASLTNPAEVLRNE